jgi:hypothetical protein
MVSVYKYLCYYVFMKNLKIIARFLSYIILAVGIFLIAEGLIIFKDKK